MAYFSPQLLVVSFLHFIQFGAHRLFLELLVQVGEKSIAKAESETFLCSVVYSYRLL